MCAGTNMLLPQEDYHIRWAKRRVEQLEERRQKGERYIETTIDDAQSLLLENIALHQRLDYMEKRICDGYNWYTWSQPVIVKKEPVQ